MNAIIKAEIAKLRTVADSLECYSGLSDFGSSRKDLADEAATLFAIADALEKAISSETK